MDGWKDGLRRAVNGRLRELEIGERTSVLGVMERRMGFGDEAGGHVLVLVGKGEFSRCHGILG
jgi:hypothetical protein